MGYGNAAGNNLALNNNPNRRTVGAGDKLPPPKGYTRIWIDVSSTAPKDKAGEVKPTDAEIEKAVFARFGLATETEADLARLKTRLGTTDNPFDFVRTTGERAVPYRANGKYRIPLDVENSLYAKLSGKAAQVKQQIETEKRAQNQSSNPNETVAGRNGYDAARQQQAKLNRLIRDAQVLPSSFGIPSKLTDLTHVVLTLPAGTAATDDNVLSAYIEKRFSSGNLFGPDKLNIQNAAKQSGVKVENLKVSANNNRVVEFDLNLESLLKLQKAYLDVQEKVNTDIAIADDVRDKMALNQFLLGVMDGAVEDVKGNYNTIRHPLETLQGIRDAIGILSQLTAQDIKNIVAELGNKAVNATPGEAAHAAGYVVGTVVVEAILAKGVGAALSALGKTKAGAEFLARIGKLAERTGEIANLGKAKVIEAFSDEAAGVAKQKFFQRIKELGLSPNSITNIAADPELWARASQVAGNVVGKGYTKFADFSKQVVKELGETAKPYLERLYRESLVSLDLAKGREILSSSKVDEAFPGELRYNIAPAQMIDVVLESEKKRIVSQLKWGLVPNWSKDAATSKGLINARAETLTEKPSFREAFKSRRCVVPATGFYEWVRPAKSLKRLSNSSLLIRPAVPSAVF